MVTARHAQRKAADAEADGVRLLVSGVERTGRHDNDLVNVTNNVFRIVPAITE